MPSAPDRYRAFLSASIRPEDEAVVTSVTRLFHNAGFDCVTVGRNVSAPEPPPETVKREMQRCECLVVVATARFTATDVHTGNVLHLASGWIDSEAGLAHMRGIPITPFKSKDVQLQGLLGSNITPWFEFDLQCETIDEYFRSNHVLIDSHLTAVKKRIEAARAGARKTTSGVRRRGFVLSGLALVLLVATGTASLSYGQRHGCAFDSSRLDDPSYQACVKLLPARERARVMASVVEVLEPECQRAEAKTYKSESDFRRCLSAAEFLRIVDPGNGYGHYYVGEARRLLNPWIRPDFLSDFSKYQKTQEECAAKTARLYCDDSARGYSLKWIAWTYHVSALTYYRHACIAPSASERESYFKQSSTSIEKELRLPYDTFSRPDQGGDSRLLRQFIDQRKLSKQRCESAVKTLGTGALDSLDPGTKSHWVSESE